jgi:hypothetical protein
MKIAKPYPPLSEPEALGRNKWGQIFILDFALLF